MTDSTVRKLITRAGEGDGLGFPAHSHMLRHACGFYLANQGHDTRAIQHYLGHRNIQHTVRYTEMAPDRFRDFWKDWIRNSLEIGLRPTPIIMYKPWMG